MEKTSTAKSTQNYHGLQGKQNNQYDNQKIVRDRPKDSQQPKKKKKVHLSFDDEELHQPQHFKITKNPALNKQNTLSKTDQTRKSSNSSNLEQILKAEYLQKVQKLKQQLIELEYQFWECGQVIKKLRRKKKEKVKDLLQFFRLQLVSSFKSLAPLTTDDLIFVVKDSIIPHEMALYEIEALQLKTKKNDMLMNLRNVKIKKQSKQITLSVNIDGPVIIIQKSKFQKNKTSYPFCNWQALKINSK